MDLFQIATLLITVAALFSYVNYQYLRMPSKIGIMAIALALSVGLLISGWLGLTSADQQAVSVLDSIDFNKALLHGMLAFLLFAGAQHLDLNDLNHERTAVILLATVSVVVSTAIVGVAAWFLLSLVGTEVSLTSALLFGALISPTDPIAVIGIMKSARAPKELETQISGESLFNDGIGVVVFLIILQFAAGESPLSAANIMLLFAEEAAGGLFMGLSAGYVAYQMLKRIDNYQVEILVTLALAMGVYALAEALPIPVSAPIAVVAAGLLIGNQGRALAMSVKTREHVDTFWELIDEILNAVLFVLLGLEVLVIPFNWGYIIAGSAAIVITLLARWVSVTGVVGTLSVFKPITPGTIPILTWAGLRGGISVALALSLPSMEHRNAIIAMTYAVVIFSIIVQGLTVGRLTEHFLEAARRNRVPAPGLPVESD
ncbi:MAG TPA: sodium:proton antiporter [Candidatus Binataceae bacterium]|nr:sodium:proton antiporter [Candidatus Binataceae bacterium]